MCLRVGDFISNNFISAFVARGPASGVRGANGRTQPSELSSGPRFADEFGDRQAVVGRRGRRKYYLFIEMIFSEKVQICRVKEIKGKPADGRVGRMDFPKKR